MGRKGRNRRSEADVDDDATSTSTSNTLGSLSELGSEALSAGDPWEDCIELLFEKRSSTREQALDTLNRLFMSGFMYDEAEAKQSTLTGLFIGSIKRGGSTECALACKALGFMTLTLGPCEQTEGYWPEARAALQGVLESSKDHGAKAAALQSLALLCFTAAEEPSDTEELLALMQKHWTSGSGPVVQAAALRAWSLLLTTAPSGLLDSDFIEASLGRLAKCLHSASVDVRAASGEAAALLYHCSGLAALDSDPAADGENGVSSQSAAQQLGMADIVDRMRDLAKNTGDASRRSRKDRASLRSTFKDLINVVEDGSQTESKVKLRHGDAVYITTLAGNVQLDAMRSFLGSGFQAHMQHNPFLHTIFRFRPQEDPADRLTPAEKRLMRSPSSVSSKLRSQTMRRVQGSKGVLHDDGSC